MQLVSVNIGKQRALESGKKRDYTGIFKEPTTAAIRITSEGLDGDFIGDTKNHGGEDQAVYVFGQSDYAWWSDELGYAVSAGTFGENLTISGLESAQFSIGDRLHIGETVILEVTAPRIPCATLAARMQDPQFVKRFKQAERPGLYCRVIVAGDVRVGDAVRVEPYTGATITALEMFRRYYDKTIDADYVRRALAAPIAIRDRIDKEQDLAKLQQID